MPATSQVTSLWVHPSRRAIADGDAEDDADEPQLGQGLGDVDGPASSAKRRRAGPGENAGDKEEGGSEASEDDFFTLKGAASDRAQGGGGTARRGNPAGADALDSARVLPSAASLAPWRDGAASAELLAALRNRFVTGDWAEGERRAAARPVGEDGESGEGDSGDEVGLGLDV